MDKVFGLQRGRGLLAWAVPAVGLACTVAAVKPLIAGDAEPGQGTIAACVIAATVVGTALVWFFRFRVLIGDAGIRIKRGLRVVDLGPPRKMRFGQFEHDEYVSSNPLIDATMPITNAWVAVEGTNGQHVLFTAPRSMLKSKLDWPYARPPKTQAIFYGDAIALRDAIGERITAG